jgi:hypothetical protein
MPDFAGQYEEQQSMQMLGGGFGGKPSDEKKDKEEKPKSPFEDKGKDVAKAISGHRAFYSDFLSSLGDMLDNLKDNMSVYQTPAEQKSLVADILKLATGRMEQDTISGMASALLTGIRESGTDPSELDIDPNAVAALAQDSPVWHAFADFKGELGKKLGEIVERSFLTPGGVDIRSMKQQMASVVGESRGRLRTIARTEAAVVSNKGRELGYQHRDPEGTYLYKWVGGIDARTCEAHVALIKETAENPLPLEKLKERVAELARAQMGPMWQVRDWVIHPNQRGAIVRVVQ